ncbi:hypothetical protein SAMN04515674_11139 [Pseudarcicella hirudinis]|uniref:Uncharacterized protein n=1 Tax=Pseudarcicella hirudinis TaxID=1079859 RepID=A0A1I5W8D5_9BACT|nr:hypothetical protein [Pseudarcicella hirudinis]SFQ15921.1 hypothetical protein SAMN04515674_11139 [Pseudarcicella hirudinis]
MENISLDLDELIGVMSGLERDRRPKKVKTLRNYIQTFFLNGNPDSDLQIVLDELERRDLIYVGINGDVIYNF